MNFAEKTPITIKYSITLYDLVKSHLWVINRNRFLLGFYCFLSLLIGLQVCHEPQVAPNTIGLKIFQFLMGFIISFLFMVGMNMVLQILFVLSRKKRGVLGQHEMEIREDGLVERTDVNESLCRWPGFHKLRKSKKYFFLYVTDLTVHVVPKTAFSSVQEAAEFEDRILQLAGRK
jgi:hypothetical protein